MTLRLALIGKGRWGRNIERTLAQFPDVELTCLGRGDTPSTALDGVLIATPSATHADIALPYLERGIATFIEKPMTTSLRDAEQLRTASEKTGAIVFVGHILLYHPAFLAALHFLPALGGVRSISCEGMNANPRVDSSVLWDWMPHDLSAAHAILGRDPVSVSAAGVVADGRTVSADTVCSYGDVSMNSSVSWQSDFARRKIVIDGRDAALVFDDKAEKKLCLLREGNEPEYPDYALEPPLTLELAAFLQAIRSGKRDAAQIDLAVSIVRAIEAAERSVGMKGAVVQV